MNDFLKMKKWQMASLAVAFTVFLLYWILSSGRNYSVFNAIPSQTAVLIDFRGFQLSSQGSSVQAGHADLQLPDLSVFRSANVGARMISRLFRRHKIVNDAIQNRPLAAAFSLQQTDSLHGLFILDLGQKEPSDALIATISDTKKVFSYTFKGHKIFTLHLSGGEKFVLGVNRNILLFSRFSYLVEDALIQLDNRNTWWTEHHFNAYSSDSPDLFRIIFRSDMLAERIQGHTELLWAQLPDWIAQKTQWISFHQKEEGAWSVSAGMHNTLPSGGALSAMNQQPLFSILPDNTALLAWAGLQSTESVNDLFTSKFDKDDFAQFIKPWAGNKLAYVIVEPYSPGMSEDQFLAIEIRDSALARFKLQEYGGQHGLLKQYDYQTFEVNQFLSQSFIAPLCGSWGKGFQNPACAIIGDYAVFASTNSAIELFIDKYIVNQTLGNSPDFLQMQRKRTFQGDFYLYFNSNYLPLFVKNIFGQAWYAGAGKDMQTVQRAGVVCLDFKQENSKQITATIAQQAIGTTTVGAGILWKTTLGGQIAGKPWIIRQQEGQGESSILAQDDQHQLHRFTTGGELIWRKQIGETILSEVYGIDYYNNGRLYYLFNTSTAIWILDDEGREVEGFPLKLQSPASNGILVVDFYETHEYSLFIACANGNLYGFDQFGRPISGWNPKSGAGRVPFPLIHFKWENKDFLAALSADGRLSVFNRNGTPHFGPLDFGGTFTNSPPQFDNHPKIPRIVCMNTDGRAYVSNLKGESFGLDLCAGAKGLPFLVYEDLTADSRKDFVTVRGRDLRISAYEGANLKSASNKAFPSVQDTLFDAGCCGMLGSLDKTKRRVYLLDKTGNLHPGFPLAGTTPFVLNRIIQNREEHILIVGNGNVLYAYKLK